MAAEVGHPGNRIYVDQDGNLHLNGAKLFDASEVDQAASLGGAGSTVIGVAGGYAVARGSTALDGSNPTPVTTGLSTVVSATVSLVGTAAPGVGTSVLTIAATNYATGALAVYAWKVTATGDCTLVASTGTETFEWIAVGTIT